MLQDQYVTGFCPFNSKKEKDRIWREMRREFGSKVKLWVEDSFVVYRYKDLAS